MTSYRTSHCHCLDSQIPQNQALECLGRKQQNLQYQEIAKGPQIDLQVCPWSFFSAAMWLYLLPAVGAAKKARPPTLAPGDGRQGRFNGRWDVW